MARGKKLMNFGHHQLIPRALLCLLGWGIFLAPIKVSGSLDHATSPQKLSDSEKPDLKDNSDSSEETDDKTAKVSFKSEDDFCGKIKSDLGLYKMLSGQLDEANKELEKPSKRDKKEVEEEIEAIRKGSKDILPRISEYYDKLKQLRPHIATEDLSNYDEIFKQVEDFKKLHEKEIEAAKKEKKIKDELEEQKNTEIPKEKAKDLKDKIEKAKTEIQGELRNKSLSSQLKAELEDTIKRLEKHEEDLNRMTQAKNSTTEEPYVPYQAQSNKPSVPEETPHSNSEPKKDDNAAKKSGSASETNSTGSGSGSSAIGPSSTATQSRGSASESNAKHSTEENGSPTLAVPKNTAETVPDNHDNRAYANSFGDQQGISPQNSTNPGNANLNPTGAGAVATPMTNSVAPNAGQLGSPVKPSATAGTTNYTIYNNGDSKQGASPNAGATSPAVSEQQAGPAPLEVKNDLSGSRPLAKLTNGKTERVNAAYNTTNAGTTNISIQQNYETPVANYEPKPDSKVQAYSLDKNGNLVATESTAGAKRDVASSGNYEASATAIQTDLDLKKLESEIADNISELKVNPTNENSKIKNETKVEPELSTIDQFVAGISDYLKPAKEGILKDIPSGGTESGTKNPDVTVTKSKPTNLLAGTKASAAEPPGWLNTIKTFWNGLWN
jgi:hypothetical protein